MKRLVPIGLLFLLLFQVAGYFITFRLIQSDIRRTVREGIESGIPESELVDLVVPNSPVEAAALGFRLEHNREIIYRGQYYDIVSRKEEGEFTRYTCFADHHESKLVNRMQEQDPTSASGLSARLQQIISLALASYLSAGEEWPGPNVRYLPASQYIYLIPHTRWDPDFPAPPPRLIT